MKFRREMNNMISAKPHEDVVAFMCPRTTLTIQRVRRLARRALDYCRGYLAL